MFSVGLAALGKNIFMEDDCFYGRSILCTMLQSLLTYVLW
jgi:hypothetical protein